MTRRQLLAELRGMGITEGSTVMVHAGLRSLGPILGGVTTLVLALLDAVGDDGTLVSYVDWELGFDDDAVPAALLDDVPAFDKRTARAARDNGILPEALRTWPGAVRSDNPEAGVVAIGRSATWVCAGHSLSYGYGEQSPYAKLVESGASVLILGAPLDTITLLHHAEHVAQIPGKRVRRYRRKILIDGIEQWLALEEFDTALPVVDGMPESAFAEIAGAALTAGCGRPGTVGAADAYIFEAASLHRIAVEWLERWSLSRNAP